MVCIGLVESLKNELEYMISLEYPEGLCSPELIKTAHQYEHSIKNIAKKY